VSESNEAPLRVLLVEDDVLLRTELTSALAGAPGMTWTAYATGAEALAHEGAVDVAIVDLGLPDMAGADLIRLLRAARPELDILVHTVHEDSQSVFDAIVAGASSYVLKGVTPQQLMQAVTELRAGGAPMSPRIARQLIGTFRQQGVVADQHALSAREKDVLARLEEGLSYKEIASALNLSTHTVHGHIKRIYEKLHASSKREALTKAKLRGFL
jgi:two-component system NarL family response regulator